MHMRTSICKTVYTSIRMLECIHVDQPPDVRQAYAQRYWQDTVYLYMGTNTSTDRHEWECGCVWM